MDATTTDTAAAVVVGLSEREIELALRVGHRRFTYNVRHPKGKALGCRVGFANGTVWAVTGDFTSPIVPGPPVAWFQNTRDGENFGPGSRPPNPNGYRTEAELIPALARTIFRSAKRVRGRVTVVG